MDIAGELRYYAHTLSPRFKELKILPISDVHYGSPLCNTNEFLETIRLISDMRALDMIRDCVYCVYYGFIH